MRCKDVIADLLELPRHGLNALGQELRQIDARPSESLAQVDAWIKDLRAEDSWSLFAVGRGIRQFESTDELRKVLDRWQTGVAADEFRSATRLARGLLATRLAFPAGKVHRAVLLTDGQENRSRRRPAWPRSTGRIRSPWRSR